MRKRRSSSAGPAGPAATSPRPFARRLVSVLTMTMVVSIGLAVAVAQPAAAYLGESEMTMSLSPGNSVIYPQQVGVAIQVRDVSDSCESPLFPSCDNPAGYITIYINGVIYGNYDIDPPAYSQYDDRSWLSVDIGIPDVGVHEVRAKYSGNFDDATATATLTVSKGDCTLELSQDKAQTVQGDAVTFSVKTPFERGDLVTFFDENSRMLGEVPIVWDGWITWGAWWTTSSLPLGTTQVHAFYMGHNYHPCISNFVDHTVLPLNTAPVAGDDASHTLMGEPVTVDVLANDVDNEGDPLGVAIGTSPANGQVIVNGNGSITYTPNPDFTGPIDTFDYRVTDPSGLSDVGTVTVFVVCLIERPDSYSVGYNTPLVVPAPGVLANDEHACDPLRGVWVADPPQHGTLDLQLTGAFIYTPNANFYGTDSFTYVFRNTLLQGPKATVTLTVATPPPNRPPAAVDAAVTVLEGTAAAVRLAGTDPDNDVLSYAVTTAASHGSLSRTGANLTYTPAAGYVGPDSILFTVNDGRGGTATGTVRITVTPTQPVATSVTALVGTRVVGARETLFEDLRARLTRDDTGAPLPGQSVTFTIDGTVICTAVTTATGDATCSGGPFAKSALNPPVNYTASYAGDGSNLLASSGSATLRSRAGNS